MILEGFLKFPFILGSGHSWSLRSFLPARNRSKSRRSGITSIFLFKFQSNIPKTHLKFQEKIIEELEFIFGTSQRPVTPVDLREMKYLEQCVKETMRLYPSVPVFARTLGEDVKLKTHTLPKGCDVVIIPFATHRLSEIFPNPEVFNPDRFDPDEVEQRHPYAYIPFSAGPRNCIGIIAISKFGCYPY